MRWRSAFSTLGCSQRPLEEVLEIARDGGWDGVELRTGPGEPVHVGLSQQERSDVRRMLADAGVAALAVASYVEIDDPGASDRDVLAALAEHVQLANDIGAPFVRVFPGGPSGDGAAARRLVAAAAEGVKGAAIALETHDSCARGEDVARLLAEVGRPGGVHVVWDVQHPWRAGEPVADTMRLLAPFIAYVQITDARSLDDPTPALPGTGVLPLREAYEALIAAGYEGWVSLEWASYWFPDAPPLEDALPLARRFIDGTLWEDQTAIR
jgi:sugar phosphate isomerase/epimerase